MTLPVVQILGEEWELPTADLRERWARCLIEKVGEARRISDFGSPYEWTSRATVASLEARAGELLMFHAAGLSASDGRVVALVGPSGTGKSTAARTLCRDDFGYVTDETVAVDDAQRVLPFPKPIAVIPADGA